MGDIIACDPGYSTGWAHYDTDTGEFWSWEDAGGTFDLRFLPNLSRAPIVVCESYVITERTAQYTQQTDALEHLGALQDCCKMFGYEFVLQQPSAKKFAKPNKLKLLGWSKKTKDNHADDAAAHLLNYLVRNQLLVRSDMEKLKSALK